MARQNELALNIDLGNAESTLPAGRTYGKAFPPSYANSVCRLLWRTASSNGTLALFDQSVVSGTRFVTTIIVGRLCGPAELGVYSLAFAVVLFAACAQEALVARPYTVYGNRFAGAKRARYAGSVLLHYALLAFVIFAVLAAASGLVILTGLGPEYLGRVLLALAVITPCTLLWEFGRRIAFAHMRLPVAVLMDVALATLQIGLLVLLATLNLLSVTNAMFAVGLATALVGLSWLYAARKRFVIRWVAALRDAHKNWLFGRWLFGGQMLGLLHGYTVPWVLAGLIGAAATGVFTACQTIVLLSNPVILGIGNMLMPSAAQAYAQGGAAQVGKVIGRALLALLAMMGCFSAILLFYGEGLLNLFFGSQYLGYGYLVGVTGTCTVAWAASAAFTAGLAVLERSRAVFLSTVAGLVSTLAVAIPLTSVFDLLGGALTLLVGSLVSAVLLGWLFLRAVRQEGANSANAIR